MPKYRITPEDFAAGKSSPLNGIKNLMRHHNEVANYVARRIAEEVVKQAKEYILDGHPNWKPLYDEGDGIGESTRQWWSAEKKDKTGRGRRESNRDGSEPLLDTGSLYDSIKIFGQTRTKKGAVVTAGSDHPAAAMHEFGSANPAEAEHNPEDWRSRPPAANHLFRSDIPARPFLAPAIMKVRKNRAFRESINKEVKEKFSHLLKQGSK
jgi:phage gpG-like protein